MFDLGGVVFAVDLERAFSYWARCAGVPYEAVRSRYRVDEWYERHERGEIESLEYFDALRRTLGINISDRHFAAGWNDVFEQEFAGVFELFQRLSPRIPIYAFSNTNVMHQEIWERRYAKTIELFREVFVSCDLGLRKPDAEAFEHVTNSIGVNPGSILFFDDTQENIEGAREIGMSAVRVDSFADIRDSVSEFLE